MRFSLPLLTLVVCVTASAQGSAPRVVLSEPAEARTAPPGGPLNTIVGQKVQTLPKGTSVEVLGRRTYGAFGGTNVWLQVRAPGTAGSVWIYGGKQVGTGVIPSGVVAEQ